MVIVQLITLIDQKSFDITKCGHPFYLLVNIHRARRTRYHWTHTSLHYPPKKRKTKIWKENLPPAVVRPAPLAACRMCEPIRYAKTPTGGDYTDRDRRRPTARVPQQKVKRHNALSVGLCPIRAATCIV